MDFGTLVSFFLLGAIIASVVTGSVGPVLVALFLVYVVGRVFSASRGSDKRRRK